MAVFNINREGVTAAALLALVGIAQATIAADPSSCGGAPITSIEQLNKTVHGRVFSNTPFALPCFSSYNGNAVTPDPKACALAQANYASLGYRSPIPGSYQNGQGGMCNADPADQCELDRSNPYNPQPFANGTDCRQGSVATHYLQVEEPSDVQAAFNYAKATGRKLTVKNSGHDYTLRNSWKGSLAIWTRKLTKLEYHSEFTPEGSHNTRQRGVKAITTGAGANCGDAYAFAEANNVTIICGYSKTVGISGGWVQGGGHSVLSPVYGLGMDRVLQFKVVTPDGKYRTANAHQNPDLFWALRGGGGSTFGVVMESTHAVEDNFPLIVANLTLPTTDSGPIVDTMKLLIDNAVRWGDLGWGGQIMHNQFIYVNPKLSLAEAKESMKPVSDFILSQGGSVFFEEMTSFHDFVHTYISRYFASAGGILFPASRLISRMTMNSEDGRAKLMEVVKDHAAHGGRMYGSVDVPTIFKHQANSTSGTPGWYKSIWHFHPTVTWTWNSTLPERQKAVKRLNTLTKNLEAVSPDTGSYLNEANPFTANWKEAYWGMGNYNRLLAIKKQVDPSRLLLCWRCIGWEESDEQNNCLTALSNVRTE
ncbi:hypothetical protein VHEMI08067 [[Torrubiella] hemipterigena]|uniref:FAD-binding PCMH-type domain-containing protein n=1 Tax=[Torrubiella] hemipterigena TaxID=1531966 RepID=A0A0A1TP14_9HYPO|nr:hypothetical protein VHEMI08067 [[Torrubiella] hemipterigena]